MDKQQRLNTRKLVLLALLTAIVVVLQLLAIVTRPLFPTFAISLVLMPIVIGAALIGVYAGMWLGLAFGLAVLLSGDAMVFLAVNPLGTILVVLVKGIVAGLAAGVVYKAISQKNKIAAVAAAAAACPIANTGVFIIGCYAFFLPTIAEWAGSDANVTAFIFLGLAGVNFLVELALNLVLVPAIVRLIDYGRDLATEAKGSK
jgi:uncharacterized membrane protein